MRKMTVCTIFIWILISGCYGISLPGLKNVKTNDEFSKIFGIVQDKTVFHNTGIQESQTSTVIPQANYAGTSLKHQAPHREQAPAGSRNMAATLYQLSGMSALQLLQILGLQLASNPRGNNGNGNQFESLRNVPGKQLLKSVPVKPTMKTTQNNDQNEQRNIQLLQSHQKDNTVITNKNPNLQQINNGKQSLNYDRFNTQQQISPLFMMTAGMGSKRFPQIANHQQSGSDELNNEGKLFDPDALMQRMMVSSSASLGTGKYDLKQNISPQNWLPNTKQQSPLPAFSGSRTNNFNPLSGQKSGSNFNPDSFNNVKMNFMPNAMMLAVDKETPNLNVKLNYDADKVNNYRGKFKPGQMFPVVNINTPSPSSHPMFNADTLNKKLMDGQNPLTYSNDEKSKSDVLSESANTIKRPSKTAFVPGLLYPKSSSDNNQEESHFSDYSTNMGIEPDFQMERRIDSIKPRLLLNNDLFDLPIESMNETKNNTDVNIATSAPDTTTFFKTNVTAITTTPPTEIDTDTKIPTESVKNGSNMITGGFIPGRTSFNQNGFVPGSFTGDGQTLQMMVNNGMFDPNKINKQAFELSHNSDNSANTNKNNTNTSQSFNMAYNFSPSTVNQAKISFNTNQQMGMSGSSGSSETNFNTFYDANKVNENSFINPFDRTQTRKNNMSTGMFDNSQFLGNFDPNTVNLISIGRTRNGTQISGLNGNFNPSEVNMAYFNPNEVNKARMNFDPSEMLEKNPGYDKETAESYKFDPDKVNDIHMNFIPPFLQDGRNMTGANGTGPRFIPGLLSGGRDDSSIFVPSKMKSGIMFNPMEMMNDGRSKNGSKDGSQTSVMFNPSAMMGNLDSLTERNKFDPDSVNKVDLQFNPNKMMKQMFAGNDNSENKNDETQQELGHGDHDIVS